MFTKNPLKKFGLKAKDYRREYIYNTVEFGPSEEMLKKMRQLNRRCWFAGESDRRYFVWPVGGQMGNAMLVVGKSTRCYAPFFSR